MARKEIGHPLFNKPYIIDKYLTSGGMNSEIYLVHHINKPEVELIAKVIYKGELEDTESFFKSYKAESITSRRLTNKPNLVQTYDFIYNEDRSQVALIQEYVEGTSLKEFIEKKGFLTPRVALSIFKKICLGVQGLHNFDHQIIHCDLKPENIIISNDLSKVTIIDFGISSVLKNDEGKNVLEALTTNGQHGTEGYMAPDYLSDHITVQYDFFALGVILYRMIMRETPFVFAQFTDGKTEHNDDEDSARIVKTIKKPLTYDMINISKNPTIPVSLENLIFRCIASKPEDLQYRYNDIAEIIDDVDKVIYQIDHKINSDVLIKPLSERKYETIDNISLTAVERGNKWYQKWWTPVILLGVSIAFILIAIIVFAAIK